MAEPEAQRQGGGDRDPCVGARLRALREIHGLSQRALAKRTGLANGTISLIEQGRTSPSVASLKKILDAFPISLAEFFAADLDGAPSFFYRASELLEIGEGALSYRLVGAGRRDLQLQVLHERYAPGADTGEEMLRHRGEEAGVVVAGEVEITVAGQRRRLGPGDAYCFASHLPHRFRNVGRGVCEIVSACTPPTF